MTTLPKRPFIMLATADGERPFYRQIYDSIRLSILRGEYQSGTRLPASRALAQELGVSRMTVINAYEQLFAEGYLEGRIGAGTYVASKLPEEYLYAPAPKRSHTSRTNKSRRQDLSGYGKHIKNSLPAIKASSSETASLPFQHSLTAIDEFPFDIWSKLVQKNLKHSYRKLSGYADPAGYRPLRQAVAAHLRTARGVQCEDEQVIMTGGAQQAVYLVARILVSPGDKIWFEDPGHLCAMDAFKANGASVVRVPVDEDGFDPSRGSKTAPDARLVYITPSRQFPLGMTMGLQRRLSLLKWANENDAWIVEDDYDSEFRYCSRPLASLQGLDKHGRVIYVGTFSKTIYPGLRIGCAVVPPELVDIFCAARTVIDQHAPMLDQMVLADFITQGHFERHIRKMRTLYKERQQILFDELDRQIGDYLELADADAGMHAIGWLPQGISDRRVSEKALEYGLRIAPVSNYAAHHLARGGLLLGYTAFDKRQIRSGVRALSKVLKEVR